MKQLFMAAVLVAAVGLIVSNWAPAAAPGPTTKARVLVLTGNEYPGHHWKETAPLLARFLADDRRLATEVQDDPSFLASPRLHEYDTVVLNYMNWESPDPGPGARANLEKFVAEGKGLVLVHFACGAFQGWPEFRQIAGRIYNPALRPHDPYGKFTVVIADSDHPVTKGLTSFETTDELYTCLDGDRAIDVLAKARSKVDGKEYPMAFLNQYQKGRVFHCVLGHDTAALGVKGVQELYRRGTAWTAGLPPAAGRP